MGRTCVRARTRTRVIDPTVARAIRMASSCVSLWIDVDLARRGSLAYVVSGVSLRHFAPARRRRGGILHVCQRNVSSSELEPRGERKPRYFVHTLISRETTISSNYY